MSSACRYGDRRSRGDESNRQWRSEVHNNNYGDDPSDSDDEGNSDNNDDADDNLKTATTKIT